ncbi:Hsp70 family protein [Actinoplanes sp. NPDC051633]|uniref:Hsp70 family protein n=1 Tax=Actinoplanes sp. NPDC051633 TaxID=3155670 RepID=UPI00342A74FE
MSIDQGRSGRHALGVDFGTSNTVAVAQWPDGRARPILIDGSPLLPSAVYAEADGQLGSGRDAVYSSRIDPSRFEPNPKRRIDDGRVLLGEREVRVVDLIAAVLGRVAEEWRHAVGPVRPEVTLTCPATWGSTRRTLLAEAAAQAGFGEVRLVAEPVAAATYFAAVLGRDVPIGSVVVVHDFGAGTFDASVVARTAEGFEVMAVDGRDDIGGLDVDAALVDHLAAGDDRWRPLLAPETLAERRAQRQLWDDVRVAKERLSRAQSADLVVPLLNHEVHVTRDELEKLARPLLDQTVQVTKGLLDWANLPAGRLAGVFLVGGASRIPLVATLLHRELGEAPVAIEQPELVVAEGSFLADAALLASAPAAPGPTAEMPRYATLPPLPPSQPAPSVPVQTVDYGIRSAEEDEPSVSMRPPVDPWAHVPPEPYLHDPSATQIKDVTPTPTPMPAPVPFATKPFPTRPMSPAPGRAKVARPAAKPQRRPQPPRQMPKPKTPKKKRRGGFLRFIQVILSIAVLIAVPLLAMVLAYGYANGDPIVDDARQVFSDIARYLGLA